MTPGRVPEEEMSSVMNLEGIYDEHAQALFAFALNLLRHEADTRDILQELFVKLARNPRLLEGVKDQRGFLLRLAHNLAIDLVRRRVVRDRNRDQVAEEAALFAVTDNPDEKFFAATLAEALGQLPPNQRAVVHLKLWERLTFEQIATTLDISPNTAGSRYRYAIDKLRERLRPIYDEIK
jgi:RNA polymerase sigma-70 factor (ECF subfamily)